MVQSFHSGVIIGTGGVIMYCAGRISVLALSFRTGQNEWEESSLYDEVKNSRIE